jgi:glycosyltransferase involved in cell wall biosynthesis
MYHAADLLVFLSNIECSPIVLFESLAGRTPFISTACGNATEIAEWTRGGVIVPSKPCGKGRVEADIASAATIIEDMMSRETRRREMAEQGYAVWKERFTWERIAQQYELLYRRLVAGSTQRLESCQIQ